MRSRGSGSGDPARPADRPRLAAAARRAEPARRAGGASRSERWRAMDCSRRCAMPHCRRAGCTAVAYPLSASSLGAAVQTRAAGYIEPVLVGPRAHRAAAGGIRPAGRRAGNHRRARRRAGIGAGRGGAGARRRRGHADEGQPAQRSFMARRWWRASRACARRGISHAFVMSVAAYPKLFILTDAAVNIAPTLAEPTSRRTPSTWRARWAWTGPRWRCCARQNR